MKRKERQLEELWWQVQEGELEKAKDAIEWLRQRNSHAVRA